MPIVTFRSEIKVLKEVLDERLKSQGKKYNFLIGLVLESLIV